MITRLRHIKQWLDGHYGTSVGWTIVLLTLWQLVIAMFGVDLCDTGYYLTFFDNIFKAPRTVEYNFMYYLSGVAGGALNAVLPEEGKWMAMRAAGVLCNTGIMVILACALRRVLPATAVILGFLMVVASLVQFPYTFNNDLMSALLWVAALALTYRGLKGGRWLSLIGAGVLIGMNTFTRIPNVLAVGLAVMPFVAQLHDYKSWLERCWQSTAMMFGVAVGMLAVIGMMVALDHWDIFMNNMNDLLGIATGRSGVASHNAGGLVMEMLRFYGQCLYVGLKMFGLFWLYYWVARRITISELRVTLRVLVAAWIVYLMWRQSHIMHPLWVMCVAGCLYVIVQGGKRAMAAWLGLFMLLVFPLGSDGATNNGGIIAWMAAPVAAFVWQRREMIVFPLAFIVVGLIQTLTVGAYFDGGALWHKTATINDSRAALIRTTPERARIINETLPELKRYLNEGDSLLCYGSMPMMNHLTNTVSPIGCTWPELLSASALSTRLEFLSGGCFGKPHRYAVLRQKFNNLGPYWSEPSDDYLRKYTFEDEKFLQQDKMDAINRLIPEKYFVWQNDWFALYIIDRQALLDNLERQ